MKVAGVSWARRRKGCESYSEDENVVLGKTSSDKCKVWQWLKSQCLIKEGGISVRKQSITRNVGGLVWVFLFPLINISQE